LPFWAPGALFFPPWMIFGMQSVSLIYQFGLHTERIGRFPRWVEAVFNTPSHHRVHHGANEQYLDRNYGGILIIWDRLFGTFVEEDDAEPCVYGTRSPLRSWNPLWANLQVYADLARDSWQAEHWADKLRVWQQPPGWRPVDVAAKWPKAPFDIACVERFDPPMTRGAQLAAAALFLALLGATTAFLWNAHQMSLPAQIGAAGGVVGTLWLVGRVSERRAREPARRPLVSSS